MMMSNRILFILDLDGALFCRLTKRPEKVLATKHPNFVKPNFKLKGDHVFVRPGLSDFLCRLFKLGDVAVWTAATPQYAVPLVIRTFYGLLDIKEAKSRIDIIRNSLNNNKVLRMTHKKSGPHKLQFLWTRAHCEVISPVLALLDGLCTKESLKSSPPQLPQLIPRRVGDLRPFEKKAVMYAKKKLAPEFIKNLYRVPLKQRQYRLEQIIVIDDCETKCRHELHRIENHIALPTFKALDPAVNHTQDRCLTDLVDFLESKLASTGHDGVSITDQVETGKDLETELVTRNKLDDTVSCDIEAEVEASSNAEDEDDDNDDKRSGLDDDIDDEDELLEEMDLNSEPVRVEMEKYTGILAKDLVAAYRSSLLSGQDSNDANRT